MSGRDDKLVRGVMKKVDAMGALPYADAETWHKEADDLIAECLLLDLSTEMRKEVVAWFRAGEKWYA